MNLKPLWTFMAAFLILGTACLFVILKQDPTGEPDVVACNDIVRTIGEQWNSVKSNSLPGRKYKMDYVVLDTYGNVLAATKAGLDTTLTAAVRHRDVILDVSVNDRIVGNVIFINSAPRYLAQQRWALLVAGLFLLLLPLLFCGGFAIYLYHKLVCPFRRLDGFARRVAAGNLDVPLEMDRDNLFGPFTESFDLMRTELSQAQKNEFLADQSKKELVASLSHDIKTPVASIQAITELMLVREINPAQRKNLETINDKAKQITALVTDLFHTSLEELQKLRVTPVEESSAVLPELLHAADYAGRADIQSAPPCMLYIDRLRLAQVFDNIFNNSYKYADTAIEVRYSFEGDMLDVTVTDFGHGAPEESLPLLCNKFYRGQNAQGKSGSGLGLYLARYFMEQMGGGLSCENRFDGDTACGFAVHVDLLLAGRET